MRQLLRYARPHRGVLVVGALVSSVGGLGALATPLLAKEFVDRLGSGQPVLWLSVLLCAVVLGGLQARVAAVQRITGVHRLPAEPEPKFDLTLQVEEGEAMPLGRALPGETAYVLGLGLRAVPDETIGELFVGGAGVARGYLGAAARTAIRFVPDPHGPPGARTYRPVTWRIPGPTARCCSPVALPTR